MRYLIGMKMLKKFILWGHRLSDYKEMFNLSDEALKEKHIVEFGAGATSFNVEMAKLGYKVISIDPMYEYPLDQIKNIVSEVFDGTVREIKQSPKKYNLKSKDELVALVSKREEGMQLFFDDFDKGRKQGRYLSPKEFYEQNQTGYVFDLALITHHLFVNYEDKEVDEHVELILQMIRLAGEVNIFPLIDKYGKNSVLLGPVMLALQQQNLGLEVCQVGSQLQKSGNAMLRVWAVKCDLTNAKESNDLFIA